MTRQIENGMKIKLDSGSTYRVRAVLPDRDHVILENKETGRYRQLKKTDYYKIVNVYK